MSLISRGREKIYYNINITGYPNPGQFDKEAKFNVALNQALIEDASQYQFLLHKFKIDTESIPLFHVDIQQPQPPVTNNTNFLTNYYLYTSYAGNLYSVPLLFSNPYYPPARVVKTTTTGVYYDNRDSLFAIYHFQSFLDMVNNAIYQLYNIAGISVAVPFFYYNSSLEKVQFFKNTSDTNMIYFSINQHPYIGEAFQTIWYHNFPIPNKVPVFSHVMPSFVLPEDNVTLPAGNFIKITQSYQAMSSWASVNRILFISSKLPIKREFYPVANSNGILNETITSYENLVSMNIICSFLFSITASGDYRTHIVYSSPTIDTADLIEMTSSGAIREIDVEVMWSDKYGNVFPLHLGPNKQVNIRFAFVRK